MGICHMWDNACLELEFCITEYDFFTCHVPFLTQANEDGCKGVRITQGKFGKKPSRKSGGGSFKRRSIRLQNRNSGALDNVSIASGGGPLPGIGPGGRPANRQRSIGGNRDSDVECKFTDLLLIALFLNYLHVFGCSRLGRVWVWHLGAFLIN